FVVCFLALLFCLEEAASVKLIIRQDKTPTLPNVIGSWDKGYGIQTSTTVNPPICQPCLLAEP
ncbi:MAG: hypothetical protein ACK40X_11350, partial [Armatimonadota bacterium]